MRLTRIVSLFGAALLFSASATLTTANAQDTLPTDKACSQIETKSSELAGWCAAVDRRQGNCLACHVMVTPNWPEGFPPGGNVAPPLVAMKSRFPDRDVLRAQIYDARDANDRSMMPPFGTFDLLNDKQIDNIVDFLYTL
jgi:sulfur-oxidizing protein SoxX